MDWMKVHNHLRTKGYHLAWPKHEDRQYFREEVKKQFGLEPKTSKVRTIYILGINGKSGEDFFEDKGLLEQASEDVERICADIKEDNPFFQVHGYLSKSSPVELIAKTLGANQGNIAFVDPYQDHKCVIVTWNDERGGK